MHRGRKNCCARAASMKPWLKSIQYFAVIPATAMLMRFARSSRSRRTTKPGRSSRRQGDDGQCRELSRLARDVVCAAGEFRSGGGARKRAQGGVTAVGQRACPCARRGTCICRLEILARRRRRLVRQLQAIRPRASAHSILGFVHLAHIDTKAARADFETAIERDSFSALPRLGLGLAMIRDGKLSRGREQLEIAVALDPSNSLLRSYVGKAYYEENSKERDALAESQFRLAEELDPNDPTYSFYDAILKLSQNRPVEALEEPAIRQLPRMRIARYIGRGYFSTTTLQRKAQLSHPSTKPWASKSLQSSRARRRFRRMRVIILPIVNSQVHMKTFHVMTLRE